MSILVDDLYLKNIEEYVKDEKRIVTCKWLSRKLSVPMNAAKKMLYHYVSQEATPTSLSIIYCVTGTLEKDDKFDMIVQLVTDDQLEAVKEQLSEVWTVHVYSVQMSQIKESAVLYSSDYEILKDYCGEYSKWNSISCDIKSCDSHKPVVPSHKDPLPNVWNSETCKETTVLTESNDKETNSLNAKDNLKQSKKLPSNKMKQQSSKGPSSFFSNNTSKSSDSGGKSSVSSVKVNKKPSAFINQVKEEAEKNKESKKLETLTKEKTTNKIEEKLPHADGLHDSDFEGEDSSNEDPIHDTVAHKKNTRAKEKPSKKKPSSTVEDHEKHIQKTTITNKKKRRRVVRDLSSDEEELENDEKPSEEPVKNSTGATEKSTAKKRKHRRKLVSKTFLSEDGSMVTQKEWEEVSTDASDNDDDDDGGRTIVTSSSSAGTKKHSKVDTMLSPSKRTKQSTLTSFFKK